MVCSMFFAITLVMKYANLIHIVGIRRENVYTLYNRLTQLLFCGNWSPSVYLIELFRSSLGFMTPRQSICAQSGFLYNTDCCKTDCCKTIFSYSFISRAFESLAKMFIVASLWLVILWGWNYICRHCCNILFS